MRNLSNKKIDIFKKNISSYKKIYIVSHIHPDGDSIGSLLGLGLALKNNFTKNVNLVKIDDVPNNFDFLPGIESLKSLEIDCKPDLLITLDCGDIDRLGINRNLIENSNYVINIDHHISNSYYGNLNIVDLEASSTGEIIYELLKCMNIKITKNIATCLYLAISSDTGSFKYDNTTPKTHLIASDLLNTGIDKNEIITNIYQSKPLTKTKLFIKAISSLELYYGNKLAVVEVSKKIINETKSSFEDSSGIVEFIRDVDGVEVACVFKEINKNEIKISLRSKKYVNVAKFAENYSGGGHKKASGCTIKSSLQNAKQEIIKEMHKIL